MRTPEDEAFDDLAKRQGDWGGGYQAKRQMAADKQKPAQEPVGVFREDDDIGYVDLVPHQGMKLKDGDFVYTAPPQRKWVGLTDDEIEAIYLQHHNQYGECESPSWGYERAIEQTLKEKNNGA
jgi:hypothetical protein